MVGWKDYREQCRRDVDACLALYRDGNYGNSAYLLQQSVEKYAKMILFHGNIFSIPIMTHEPLSKFAKDILPIFGKIDALVKKYDLHTTPSTIVNLQQDYLRQCANILPQLKNSSVKIAIWKNSLGIVLDASEKAIFAQYQYFTSPNRFSLDRIIASGVGDVKEDQFMKEANSDHDIKRLRYYKMVAEIGRMIVTTFPHEDYGRYPTDIPTATGTKLSTDLYQQHKTELGNLIDIITSHIRSKI
jgi:hypothetical protein